LILVFFSKEEESREPSERQFGASISINDNSRSEPENQEAPACEASKNEAKSKTGLIVVGWEGRGVMGMCDADSPFL